MIVSNKQKQEAIQRMEQLQEKFDLNPQLVNYLQEGRVYYSYLVSDLFGCIDTITYDERYAKAIGQFEESTGAYVYHAIETKTFLGTMLALLYVSSEESEESWREERLYSDYILAYVYNLEEEFGEYGDISLTSDNGALLRNG